MFLAGRWTDILADCRSFGSLPRSKLIPFLSFNTGTPFFCLDILFKVLVKRRASRTFHINSKQTSFEFCAMSDIFAE